MIHKRQLTFWIETLAGFMFLLWLSIEIVLPFASPFHQGEDC